MSPTNRLAAEKSPYLQQHAHNPVDWYPWGEEAIERARREDRPIFLSIGYSTCHWCHVMERESFEDEATATFMNEHFVNVKVDREEHPDVDQIYMAAVQATTGHGGWPMSVFLTPDLEPILCGTYFPPVRRYGQPAFREVLAYIVQAWQKQRAALVHRGRDVLDAIRRNAAPEAAPELPGREIIDAAVAQIEASYDPTWGGFGQAPKFPRPMTLMLLLRALGEGEDRERRLEMVDKTLEMMWRGGMYDHVGGGFARYSTDERWLVPHFEKMLYDNALLVLSYLEAWQVTGRSDWPAVVEETLEWVLREMTHERGGFFSALDADSEGEEGRFYVWTPREIDAALEPKDAEIAQRVFGVTPAGNFEGKNILFLPRPLDEAAADLDMARSDLDKRLAAIRNRLLEVREERVRPGLDDKILTSWNGLMIAAMARAGFALARPRYVEAAARAAAFCEQNLVKDDGACLRRWRDGEAALEGTLDDHAFLAWGFVELFLATSDVRWLDAAERTARLMCERFGDREAGGFWFTAPDTPFLVARMKESWDGATPSGNAIGALVLLMLSDLLGDDSLRSEAERTVRAVGGAVSRSPMAHPMLACVLDRMLVPPEEIVIERPSADDAAAAALVDIVRKTFLPHAVWVTVQPETIAAAGERIPFVRDRAPTGDEAAAWSCRAGTCRPPVHSPDELARILHESPSHE